MSVHVGISVLKPYRLILTSLRCSTRATGNSWLHPLPSYNTSQNKHSKDSNYSIISSLVDTYYCLIWACFESVVLNTGPGVILTSAVLRTSENSRIRVCVHWEYANWLNRCAQHLLFSHPCIRRTRQPFFLSVQVKEHHPVQSQETVALSWNTQRGMAGLRWGKTRGAVFIVCVSSRD